MAKSILPEGTGTPYVTFFNGSGIVLTDLVTGLPVGTFVTSFKFEQKEGETKEVSITLKVPTQFAIRGSDIAPYAPIKVKWGWIYPDGTYTYGPLWNLVVVGMEVSYTPTAIDINLKLNDRTILLKNSPVSISNEFLENWELIKQLLMGIPVFVEIYDYQNVGSSYTPYLIKNEIRNGTEE